MRILHLPFNIASQLACSVQALCNIGVSAHGLSLQASRLQDDCGILQIGPASWRGGAYRFLDAIRSVWVLLQYLLWADVIHWHFGMRPSWQRVLLMLAKLAGKRQVVEFWGSDIRIPQVEAIDNPHYVAVLDAQEYRHIESFSASLRRQLQFGRYCSHIMCSTGLREFVHPRLRPRLRHLPQRVDCARYRPVFPEVNVVLPVIAHAPSAPIIKGTAAVLAAVEALGPNLCTFKLIQGLPHDRAVAEMAGCDIFVDQLRLGHHGLAAIEAMALGKPVVAWIKPAMRRQYPADCPIVIADPDTLTGVLADLLQDGIRRRLLGIQGRRYVERYHDAPLVAMRMMGIYQEAYRQ